ncbi:MAG: TIGR00341 family protein, partial [Brasilonema sp.]
MRQLIIQVPRGNGEAIIEIAKSHNGTNLLWFEASANDPIDVAIVHVSNQKVGKFVDQLQDLPKVHITLIPTGVMALQPPASEAPQQVVDVEERSPIEILLSGLQSVGSWRGFLGYAALAGFVVWIGL